MDSLDGLSVLYWMHGDVVVSKLLLSLLEHILPHYCLKRMGNFNFLCTNFLCKASS